MERQFGMINKQSNAVFVIFGMGPAGLFLARQLRRAGFHVCGIGKEDDIGRYSNCLEHYYATEDIKTIHKIVKEITVSSKPKGYICSDQYLTMFLEEWKEVFTLIDFQEPSLELLDLIADKEALIRYCETLGIPFPKSYGGNAENENIVFPVAIKPNIKRGYSPIKKVTVISDQKSLDEFLENARGLGLTKEELLVQQFIPGDNRFEYGYGGYFRDGNPIIDVVFQQLRQYPQGVSCYTCEVMDATECARVRTLVAPFLKATSYCGFLQFDIKKHGQTEELYVLDVNPRPWGSISMLEPKCGSRSLFEHGFTAEPVKVRWRFPFKEIVSFRNSNNVSYGDIRKIISECEYKKVVDLYDPNDKKPFFMQISIAGMKVLKKLKHR
ncbi:MAG: hypothetical protein IJL46_00570 [Clostridia bacterium]|nr:hypothetical protein [Clostridia bacterium]MBQ5956044.1 hypothetical protein [Clostridia bacterium]